MTKLATNKGQGADIMVIGLALFAMFFGAGNLIFPPTLGMNSGTDWFLGFMCFLIADIGLGFVTIIAMMKGDGSITGVTGVIGKIPSLVLNTAVIVCIGPLLAIPRTAATTFEMAVMPVTDKVSIVVFSLVFFIITFLLSIRPSKIVDIVGKFLTPIMFVALIVLIVVGVMSPLDHIHAPASETVVKDGILAGYQAMDVLGALGFAIIVISTVIQKGYTSDKAKTSVTAKSCVLAGLLLFVVYGGLAYLGASSGYAIVGADNQAALLVAITNGLVGKFGVVMLGVIVALACLTTAIGLTSAAGSYFESITHGKLKYEITVIAVVIISFGVCNLGLAKIISLSVPILTVVYPLIVDIILLNFFKKRLNNVNVFRVSAVITLVISLLSVINTSNGSFAFVNSLPLATYGFNWVVPALVGAVIGYFCKFGNYQTNTPEVKEA